MSRASDVLNDLEIAAHKLGMSVEEAVSVLIGKHPTHGVVQVHAADPKVPAADPKVPAAASMNTNAASSTEPPAENPPVEDEKDTPGAAA